MKPAKYPQHCLIGMALSTSNAGDMFVGEIYKYIETTFPHATLSAPNSWKNSLRHSLSRSGYFEKSNVDGLVVDQLTAVKKGNRWRIKPDKALDLLKCMQKCNERRSTNITPSLHSGSISQAYASSFAPQYGVAQQVANSAPSLYTGSTPVINQHHLAQQAINSNSSLHTGSISNACTSNFVQQLSNRGPSSQQSLNLPLSSQFLQPCVSQSSINYATSNDFGQPQTSGNSGFSPSQARADDCTDQPIKVPSYDSPLLALNLDELIKQSQKSLSTVPSSNKYQSSVEQPHNSRDAGTKLTARDQFVFRSSPHSDLSASQSIPIGEFPNITVSSLDFDISKVLGQSTSLAQAGSIGQLQNTNSPDIVSSLFSKDLNDWLNSIEMPVIAPTSSDREQTQSNVNAPHDNYTESVTTENNSHLNSLPGPSNSQAEENMLELPDLGLDIAEFLNQESQVDVSEQDQSLEKSKDVANLDVSALLDQMFHHKSSTDESSQLITVAPDMLVDTDHTVNTDVAISHTVDKEKGTNSTPPLSTSQDSNDKQEDTTIQAQAQEQWTSNTELSTFLEEMFEDSLPTVVELNTAGPSGSSGADILVSSQLSYQDLIGIPVKEPSAVEQQACQSSVLTEKLEVCEPNEKQAELPTLNPGILNDIELLPDNDKEEADRDIAAVLTGTDSSVEQLLTSTAAVSNRVESSSEFVEDCQDESPNLEDVDMVSDSAIDVDKTRTNVLSVLYDHVGSPEHTVDTLADMPTLMNESHELSASEEAQQTTTMSDLDELPISDDFLLSCSTSSTSVCEDNESWLDCEVLETNIGSAGNSPVWVPSSLLISDDDEENDNFQEVNQQENAHKKSAKKTTITLNNEQEPSKVVESTNSTKGSHDKWITDRWQKISGHTNNTKFPLLPLGVKKVADTLGDDIPDVCNTSSTRSISTVAVQTQEKAPTLLGKRRRTDSDTEEEQRMAKKLKRNEQATNRMKQMIQTKMTLFKKCKKAIPIKNTKQTNTTPTSHSVITNSLHTRKRSREDDDGAVNLIPNKIQKTSCSRSTLSIQPGLYSPISSPRKRPHTDSDDDEDAPPYKKQRWMSSSISPTRIILRKI